MGTNSLKVNGIHIESNVLEADISGFEIFVSALASSFIPIFDTIVLL
jgi:hypothetical protein